jgi:hypothetical protein
MMLVFMTNRTGRFQAAQQILFNGVSRLAGSAGDNLNAFFIEDLDGAPPSAGNDCFHTK